MNVHNKHFSSLPLKVLKKWLAKKNMKIGWTISPVFWNHISILDLTMTQCKQMASAISTSDMQQIKVSLCYTPESWQPIGYNYSSNNSIHFRIICENMYGAIHKGRHTNVIHFHLSSMFIKIQFFNEFCIQKTIKPLIK